MSTQTTTEVPATNEIVSALLAAKYATDKTLLAAIRTNPRKALGGGKIAMEVRAVQNTGDTLHICIPAYDALKDMKLDDVQLAQLSGGGIFISGANASVFAAGIAAVAAGVALGGANLEGRPTP